MIETTDFFIDGPVGRLALRAKNLDGRRPVVVMVQGSNLTGQAMFDLEVDGDRSYSLMHVLAEAGFAPVTFSVRGYGASEPPADPFDVTTDAAIEDLSAVIDWVSGQSRTRPHVLAFSWGGRIAGRYAETNARKIARLVLMDPARGGGNLILPAPTEPWWENKGEHYLEKLEPEFTPLALRRVLAAYVDAHENRSPNGIRLENATHTIEVRPEAITSPTLLVYGCEAAKAAYMHGGLTREVFFEKLATDDKCYAILPGGGDFIHLQNGRFRLHKTVINFLNA